MYQLDWLNATLLPQLKGIIIAQLVTIILGRGKFNFEERVIIISKQKILIISLVTALVVALSFPLMGIGAATDSAAKPSLDQMIEKYAQKKGITVEEAKAQYEAKLKEIASKKGITVEELKQQISEGKFKGHYGKGKHRGPLDEAKLKEIAEKKGISVEELKKQMSERKCPKGPIDEAKLKEIADKKGISVEQLKEQMAKHRKDSAKPLQ